jgi:hypothetical protein
LIRALVVSGVAATLALCGPPLPSAAADPPAAGDTAYLIGACWDPSQPVEQQPARIVYGCDLSSVMENMSWSSWGADGASGTGTDNAVECQPNCAEGRRLFNPIIVHAWNPLPADKPGCPAGVEFYSDFTVAYPEAVPPWVKPGTSWTDGVDYTYVDGLPAVHFSSQGPLSCTPLVPPQTAA